VTVLQKQVATLMHVSNLYYHEPQARLGKMLTERSGLERAFFCNSGAEANEAAIKFVRKWAKQKIGPEATQIITAEKSFHGRTLGTIAATGQPKFRAGFEPNTPGFIHVPFNDLAALEAAVSPETCAIMLEPTQCESGVHPASKEYWQGVRDLCDRKGIALILDEVQTGMGRTGKLFAHQHYGIKPDVMSLAKALGSGVPVAACLLTQEIASAMAPGDHGTTFGGGLLACTAGIATIETMEDDNLLANCLAMGKRLKEGFQSLQSKYSIVKEIRGLGLIWGIELSDPVAKEVGEAALEAGLIINSIGDCVLRMSPPLIITNNEVDEALGILDTLFARF
jgi:predicted acetylornithine/succinylornithine family transaminase